MIIWFDDMKNVLLGLGMLGSIVCSGQEALKEFTQVELKDCFCVVDQASQLDYPGDGPTVYESNKGEILVVDNIQTETSGEYYIQYKTNDIKLETDVYGKDGTIYQQAKLNDVVKNNDKYRTDIQEVLCAKMKDIIAYKNIKKI